MATNSHGVFLSHASSDKEVVERIALRLKEAGITPWLDKWNLIPGQPWQEPIEEALSSCAAVAVFIGPKGLAPWHNEEMRAAIQRRVTETGFPVVPVLLPGALREERGKLPPFLTANTWVEFPTEDDGEAIRRLVCGIQGLPPGPAPSGVPAPTKKPYRGLQAFDVGDADIFFGREALTDDLLQRLKVQGQHSTRFLAVLGPSGSGKSSLARAGLLAALKTGRLPGSDTWPQLVLRPGPDPLEALAIELLRLWPDSKVDPQELMTRLAKDERALHLHTKVALPNDAARLVLLVDQAEELFSLCADEARRLAFLDNVLYAATVASGQVIAILAMRADFYPRCAEYPQLAALVSEHQRLVGAMAQEELRRAIEAPASRAGRPLRPELVAQIIADVADRPGALPLLEHALEVLWELPVQSPGIAEYRQVGGMAAALDARAEGVFQGLSPDEQRAARELFLRLVQLGEGTEDTRRRVAGSELSDEQRRVSEKFAAAGAHLLIWGGDGTQKHLELAHEALIREWKRFGSWLSEDRHGQRVHRRLTTAVADWASRGRLEDELYPRSRIGEVEEWLQTLPSLDANGALSKIEREFLECSRERLDRAERERAEAQERLERQRNLAVSRELAAQALAKLEEDPILALSLLKSATDLAVTEQLPVVLSQWKRSPLRAVLRGHTATVWTAEFSQDGRRVVTASDDSTARVWDSGTGTHIATLKGHSGYVVAAEFSPDRQRVVTSSLDKTARVWDSETGSLIAELKGHSGYVVAAEFSPDGRRVVTASDDRTARVWNSATATLIAELKGHSATLRTAEFSPDGWRVVTASDDKTARVWDWRTGSLIAEIKGHSGHVVAAEFSQDGRHVVTASEDHTARVWNSGTGALIAELKGHSAMVRTAEFSQDGRRIVTASWDSTARVWDSGTGTLIAELKGHSGSVNAAEFSQDGQRVVTASLDNTARVWDSGTGTLIAELKGHSAMVRTAEFSQDARRVVTASLDNTARVWDPATATLIAELKGHSATVRTAKLSQDARRVVTASFDKTARLWDPATGTPIAEFKGHSATVRTAKLSQDGRRVVTASDDHTARVWDAETGTLIAELKGHSGYVVAAEFSEDGRRVVTASLDNTARVWDSATATLIAELKGHSARVRTAELSQDGRHVVTACDDHTARVWDAETGALIAELKGHSAMVRTAKFNQDGRHVATTSNDKTARLWDSASAALIAELKGHSATVRAAEFSQDGRRVVTASSDNTARLWDSATGNLIAELKGHSARVRTAMFSQDGLSVLTASEDGTARVWRDHPALWPRERQLEFLKTVRDLTPEERRIYLHEGEDTASAPL